MARKRTKTPTNSSGTTHGGRRAGAGRPLGSGSGPSPDSRRNRVAVMITDTELRALERIARAGRQPVATAAYEIIERALRRAAAATRRARAA